MDTQARPHDAKRIVLVVGVDFTDASEYALALSKNLVRSAGTDAHLHLVHVAHPPAIPDTVVGVLPELGPTVEAIIERTRQQLLDAYARVGDAAVANVVAHVLFGDPVIELATVARELSADLIVVGAHRRRGFSRALHRSITARLAVRAPCSVFTALPKELPPEAEIEPPCEDCLALRRDSANQTLWCQRHAGHHVHGHLHRAAMNPFAVESWTFRA